MKPIDTLRVRAMEVRVRLAELSTAEMTDDSRAEIDTLRTEYTDLERRQSAMLIADDTPEPIETATSGEGKEYRELRNAASFSRYVAAAMAGRGVSPNPPMDRDGRGEDTGRGRGSNRRGWSGLEFG